MKKFIFANWKLYLSEPTSVRLARSLRFKDRNVELAIFPSELAFHAVAKAVCFRLVLGSQNIAPTGKQAATGEVSGADLKRLGCRYVIVGHSERRVLGESDATIRSKLSAAVRSRLIPVLCVGETKRTSPVAAQKFVRAQLARDLKGWKGTTLCVTYEPVWAISKAGKGRACSPKQAATMAQFMRGQLIRLVPKTRTIMLYGGSVNGSNIADYVDGKIFDGALVGHASTKPAELRGMVKAIS